MSISDSEIYQIENLIENEPARQNIHRTYLRLYQATKNKMYIEKAISSAIFNFSGSEKPFLETQLKANKIDAIKGHPSGSHSQVLRAP